MADDALTEALSFNDLAFVLGCPPNAVRSSVQNSHTPTRQRRERGLTGGWRNVVVVTPDNIDRWLELHGNDLVDIPDADVRAGVEEAESKQPCLKPRFVKWPLTAPAAGASGAVCRRLRL